MSILVWRLKTSLLHSSPRINKMYVLVSSLHREILVTFVYQKIQMTSLCPVSEFLNMEHGNEDFVSSK